MKRIYLIKDLALETGYSTHTLKYYLKEGLFEEMGRSPSTNFRYFDKGAVMRLQEIRKMKNKGMQIKEIKKALSRKL